MTRAKNVTGESGLPQGLAPLLPPGKEAYRAPETLKS